MIVNEIYDLIGNTPIVKINTLTDNSMADIYVKLENLNLTGSIKIRAAYHMIIDAINDGRLTKDKVLIEPSSGNTGIALSYIANLLGYKIIIVMPESMSPERVQIMEAYHAQVILTKANLGMQGAINKAFELAQENGHVLLQQFNNPSNVKAHYDGTGVEILNDFDSLDAFVVGVGTGGTITGVSKRLSEKFPNLLVYAVEPSESPILSKGVFGPHKIQGIGAGIIPQILNQKAYSQVITIESALALAYAKEIYLKEGLFLGISSAANILAAIQVAKLLGPNKKVLTIAPDGGEKYLSNKIFEYDK